MSVSKPRVRPSKAKKFFISLSSLEAQRLLACLYSARRQSDSDEFNSVIEQLEAQNVSGCDPRKTERRT